MEASYELLSCPEAAKEATSELFTLPINPEDMACELPEYPAPATGAIQELPSRSVITMVTLNELSVCPVNPVTAKETISEPSVSSVSVNELMLSYLCVQFQSISLRISNLAVLFQMT